MEKVIKALSVEVVVLTYHNGECIAFRKDDPRLLDELLENHDSIEIIDIANYFPPPPPKPDIFLEEVIT